MDCTGVFSFPPVFFPLGFSSLSFFSSFFLFPLSFLFLSTSLLVLAVIKACLMRFFSSLSPPLLCQEYHSGGGEGAKESVQTVEWVGS